MNITDLLPALERSGSLLILAVVVYFFLKLGVWLIKDYVPSVTKLDKSVEELAKAVSSLQASFTASEERNREVLEQCKSTMVLAEKALRMACRILKERKQEA